MTYHLDFHIHGNILNVYAAGEGGSADSGVAAEDVWKRIAQKCEECSISRILILSGITRRYPTHDCYEITSTLDRYGISRDWKIAYVNGKPHCRQELLSMIVVAQNRGFGLRLFEDKAKAYEWLRSRW